MFVRILFNCMDHTLFYHSNFVVNSWYCFFRIQMYIISRILSFSDNQVISQVIDLKINSSICTRDLSLVSVY